MEDLKGYPRGSDYMGLTDEGWMRFETEGAYKEYMQEKEQEKEE